MRYLGSLLLKLQDYEFDIKYLEGAKLKVSNTLSRLYIEEKHKITDVIPLNFLLHTAEPFIHLEYLDNPNELYTHKAVKVQIKMREPKHSSTQNQQLTPAGPSSSQKSQMTKSHDQVKQKGKKIINDQKKEQIQDIIQALLQSIQAAIINKSINPDLKTLFDVESNKEVITSIREPDPGMLFQQRPIMLMPENSQFIGITFLHRQRLITR